MTKDADLWRAYRRTRDAGLRDRLIEKNLGLVKYAATWVAGRLPTHLRLDDLYSAGMLGFLDAVEDYDPDRGVEFSAYAGPRIRGAIFDELRRLDCVPRRVRRRFREAQRVIDALGQSLNRQPTDDEIAGGLGIAVEEYQRLLAEGVTLLSLDTPSAGRDESDGGLLETLADAASPGPLSTAEMRELRALLVRLIDALPGRERQVLALYYYEELTMDEVGQVLGVTESRISQIHTSAVLRLRGALRRRHIGATELGRATVRPGGAAPRAAPR